MKYKKNGHEQVYFGKGCVRVRPIGKRKSEFGLAFQRFPSFRVISFLEHICQHRIPIHNMVGWIFLKLAEKKRVRHSFKTLHIEESSPEIRAKDFMNFHIKRHVRSFTKGTFVLLQFCSHRCSPYVISWDQCCSRPSFVSVLKKDIYSYFIVGFGVIQSQK